MRRTLVAGSIVMLVLTASCGLSRRREAGATLVPERSASVGLGLLETVPTTKPTPRSSAALFILLLTDDRGLHPQGIPIRVEGAQNRIMFTNARGEIEIYSPGTYKFSVIEGCHERVRVLGGGYATVGVTRGQTKRGKLPVQWQHRFGPSPPVYTNPQSEWKVGRNAGVRYDVIDRCSDRRAPTVSLPTFAFQTSPILQIVGTPVMRADSAAHATVTVRCRDTGNPGFLISDTQNPSDSLDLIRATIGFGGPPHCVR